jgi:type VI secretion system protein ImpG
LTEEGLGALKEMLSLYNLAGSLPNQRHIDGLVAVAHRPVTASMRGNPFPTFVKGIEIELTLDEQNYVGTGIYLFARVLDHFFSLYVHANSFTRLIVRSARSGEIILQCPPRNGELALV